MICPAILDPFQGGNYRVIACLHQALLCPIVSKTFNFLFAIQRDNDEGIKQPPTVKTDELNINKNEQSMNNHTMQTKLIIGNDKIRMKSVGCEQDNDINLCNINDTDKKLI